MRIYGILTLAMVGALEVSVFGRQAADPKPAVITELPRAVHDALNDQFKSKGWSLAPVDAPNAGCHPNGPAPNIIQADFNSDGQMDVAAAIKTKDGVRLVAIIDRVADSTVIDVDSLGQAEADGYLAIERRGAQYKIPEDGMDEFFSGDTLAVYRCGKPRTVYLWSGAQFRKVTLSDD